MGNINSITQSEKAPRGAVMVVGGGIAGMQASLDLANQGFKVYMVEKETAIGGKMAQLDKTFPTNDCAMCTISPKLVETGRHPNIEIITNAEVQKIEGEVGAFQAKVIRYPRYIDNDKCVACNDCVDVCPVDVPNPFNEYLDDRRAVYKLYPQAVPNAYAIRKEGIAPCRDACPAGQRAQGYIALASEGRWEDALRVIKMDNPFPGICGRICNHRCEDACNRGEYDQPVNIRALKRYITDKVYAGEREKVEKIEPKYENHIAVIGSGPAGLTAAQDLVMAGYLVTVYETHAVAGGMLRLGVPEFRLPDEIIDREVQDIIDLGVNIKLNHPVRDIDNLFDEGYEAILIATGAQQGVRLPIPGADHENVLINSNFLRDVRLQKYGDNDSQNQLGKKVLVLGGGNVAIDCARNAVRLGKTVEMACLEPEDNMPAHEWEIRDAVEEGIKINNSRTFERIVIDESGKMVGVECTKVASFSFDEDGKLNLETVPDSEHVIECDNVIFSVGQRVGLDFLGEGVGVDLSLKKTVDIDPDTMATSREGVFAAGDSVTSTAFAIDAIASGHKSAEAIDNYLQGRPLKTMKVDHPVVKFSREEVIHKIELGEASKNDRINLPMLNSDKRIQSFEEVELPFTDQMAMDEAERCLSCGICSECMSCVFVCGADAIDHDMVAREETFDVGAVILAPGYQIYNAELSEEYGLGRYPNVVTSLQFERLLSASGPTFGHVQRDSDGETPKRVAFLQCVGSRDQNHDYCSAVCCMYAAKEASIAAEHYPDMDIQIFMMDMRAFSKGYLGYFERSEKQYGVKYIRSRVSMVHQDPKTNDLLVVYQDEEGNRHQEIFNMVVLSVGMEISDSVKELGNNLGIELDEYGFCKTVKFNPLETSREGIYAVGPFREPKDIPESVLEASAAAASAASMISDGRYTITEKIEYPEEVDVIGQEPRVGVFVCHCGSNIGGYLDVPDVTLDAGTLPGVVHAEANLYTCSQDSIGHITEQVKEHKLNRVVVASCTPITHQPLFKDSIRAAGLNPYLFEMANIRNQCSWVHSKEWDTATNKAKELVRMAVAKVIRQQPQQTFEVPVEQSALVVGGGAAGMTAAVSIAQQGFPVHLVEKSSELGGNLRHIFGRANGKDPQVVLSSLIDQVMSEPLITLYLNTVTTQTDGFKGNFSSTLQSGSSEPQVINHGAIVIATGAEEYRGNDYGYGSSDAIITQQEFEEVLHNGQVEDVNSIVMIQCVGPAEQFCSRICCTSALKNAISIKNKKPEAQVVVLYKDIRSYGFKEKLYTEAREHGVLFMRYDDEHKPVVNSEGAPIIQAWEPMLRRNVELSPDLLVLSMPVVPSEDSKKVGALFNLPLDADGFFLEAHVKLRPVDFSTSGVFMAGLAHYPKLLDESMIQAQAAAAKVVKVISKETMTAGGRIAVVDQSKCTGCLTCVRICPFNVPVIKAGDMGVGNIIGAAYVEPAVCQGCGSCVSECPASAIQLMNFTDEQMWAKVGALLDPQFGFIPLEDVLDQGSGV
jgi:heterodisulfide reductase subunit A-like polyferredoxin